MLPRFEHVWYLGVLVCAVLSVTPSNAQRRDVGEELLIADQTLRAEGREWIASATVVRHEDSRMRGKFLITAEPQVGGAPEGRGSLNTLAAGESKEVAIHFDAPHASKLQGADYTVTLLAVPQTRTHRPEPVELSRKTVYLTFPKARTLPDLVIVKEPPPRPVVDEQGVEEPCVKVVLRVRNDGTGLSRPYRLHVQTTPAWPGGLFMQRDGVDIKEGALLPGLPAGEVHTVLIELVITPACRGQSFGITAAIGDPRKLSESDRDRKQWTGGFQVDSILEPPGATDEPKAGRGDEPRGGRGDEPKAGEIHGGGSSSSHAAEMWLIAIIAVIAIVGVVVLVSAMSARRRRLEWQKKAREEEPPEQCTPCNHYCRKIELEFEPGQREVAEVASRTQEAGSTVEHGTSAREVVERLNQAIRARRRGKAERKVETSLTPVTAALVNGVLAREQRDTRSRDAEIVARVEGGELSCKFILYHCERIEGQNVWKQEKEWTAKVSSQSDHLVAALQGLTATEEAFSAVTSAIQTGLLRLVTELAGEAR